MSCNGVRLSTPVLFNRLAAAVVLCLVGAARPTVARPLLPEPMYPVGEGTHWIGAADLDHDGVLDLVALQSDQIALLFGRPDGTFEPAVLIRDSHLPQMARLADLDGDGNVDLVLAEHLQPTGRILWNHGDGTFEPSATTLDVGSHAAAVAVEDLDLDGDPDLVFSCGFCRTSGLVVVRNESNRTFAPPQGYSTRQTGVPGMVLAADLNGDPFPDLAVLFPEDGRMGVVLNQGDGTFGPLWTQSIPGTPRALTAVDVDDDGDRDLLVTRGEPAGLNILLNRGNGTFSLQPDIPTGPDPRQILALDLDDDAQPEILTVDLSGELWIYNTQPPDATLELRTRVPFGITPNALAAGDFNADGITDLAATNTVDKQISVLLHRGHGQFLHHQRYPLAQSSFALATADINSDGLVDLCLGLVGNVTVIPNAGDGTFAQPLSTVPAGYRVDELEVADLFTGHGPDLIAFSVFDNTLTILRNDGTGQLETVQTLTPANSITDVQPADLDGDGTPEILLAEDARTVAVLARQGQSQYQLTQQIPWPATPASIALADLDADGDPDLLVSLPARQEVAIRLNLGNGAFTDPVTYATDPNPRDIATADLDGDGDIDFLVVVGHALMTFFNDGSGTFSPGSTAPTGRTAQSLHIADLNLDGAPDVVMVSRAVGGFDPGWLSVMLNRGDGTFEPRQAFGAGLSPWVATVADLDQDHDPDVIVTDIGFDHQSYLVLTNQTRFPADLDGSGCVDTADLARLLSHLGSPAGATRADGDLDNDHDVDLGDLSRLLSQFGRGCQP